MQGSFLILLEEYSLLVGGAEQLERIRQRAGVKEPLLPTFQYLDELVDRLIWAMALTLGQSEAALCFAFGRYLMTSSHSRQFRVGMPSSFSLRHLLEQDAAFSAWVTERLHAQTALRLSIVREFAAGIELTYQGSSHLCSFLLGLIAGLADYFQEQVEVSEVECQKSGAPTCRFQVAFGPVQKRTDPGKQVAQSGATGAAPLPPPAWPPAEPSPVRQAGGSQQSFASGPGRAGGVDEEELELLILQLLVSGLPTGAMAQSDAQALSVFDLAQYFGSHRATEHYKRVSLIQHGLDRLVAQGLVERSFPAGSKAAQHNDAILPVYRITMGGTIWLARWQQGG